MTRRRGKDMEDMSQIEFLSSRSLYRKSLHLLPRLATKTISGTECREDQQLQYCLIVTRQDLAGTK